MEKSWNMKTCQKVMEFCDQSWKFTNFSPKLYQICTFFVTTMKLSIFIFRRFLQNVTNTKLKRGLVMEDREMVRERSRTNILSSLWERCTLILILMFYRMPTTVISI